MKRNSVPKRDMNFLPPHIGKAFQDDLSALVADISVTEGFKGRYLASEYLSKYSDPTVVSPDMRRKAAIKKWLTVEKRNEVTNARIQLGDCDFGYATSSELIQFARKIVSKVLGPLDTTKIFRDLSHTNGASTRVRRGPKARIDKHGGKAHLSSSALKHWLTFASSTRLSNQDLEIQDGSELFTVPKKTDIDRVACKEPEINMILQRGVGSHIRRNLRKFGIDLNDQTKNQRLAKEALSKNLCTIDLSSASDSISQSLVIELLPTDWWSLLDDLRVHYTTVDGGIHRLQMFSSMGNGFTFELESLLFWSLTRAIAYFSSSRGEISVYGDDIIAPKDIGPRLARTFNWFGFTVNQKKSNWSGLFRESCGKHYHGSVDVTPFYLREAISSKTDMIKILNRLLIWDSCGFKCFTTPRIAEFHFKWSLQIPRVLWGGDNPDEITSLVTGHLPSKRISWVNKSVPYSYELGLESWFLTNEDSKDVSSFEPIREGKAVYSKPEPFRDRSLTLYDHGRVKSWDPYMIYGPYLMHKP